MTLFIDLYKEYMFAIDYFFVIQHKVGIYTLSTIIDELGLLFLLHISASSLD